MEKAIDAALAPWAGLGIAGSVVVALALIAIYLWRELQGARAALLAEVKACHLQMLDITVKRIESENKMAEALEGLERVIETALAALRK